MANDNVDLQTTEREGRGKRETRKLRAVGMTPAILYGDGEQANTPLAVPAHTVDYTLQHLGDNALYDLGLSSGKATARIVDVQRDPVSGRLIHVDFTPVNMREVVEVTVPVSVVGEAVGVLQDDGVLQQVAYEIQVESLPGNIPQEIPLDVSELGMGENLTLADLDMPEGVTLISEAEEVAATVTAPTEISEEEIEAAGIVEEESEEMGEEADEEVLSGEETEEAE